MGKNKIKVQFKDAVMSSKILHFSFQMHRGPEKFPKTITLFSIFGPLCNVYEDRMDPS